MRFHNLCFVSFSLLLWYVYSVVLLSDCYFHHERDYFAVTCRYPFYILTLLNKDVYVLTWLRYTAWILLYPAGIATEGDLWVCIFFFLTPLFLLIASIIYHSLPHVTRTEIWSLRMPNNLKFAFDFVAFLWIYLIVLSSGSKLCCRSEKIMSIY